ADCRHRSSPTFRVSDVLDGTTYQPRRSSFTAMQTLTFSILWRTSGLKATRTFVHPMADSTSAPKRSMGTRGRKHVARHSYVPTFTLSWVRLAATGAAGATIA